MMALNPSDIAEGKCYKTDNNQHRKIIKIEDGKVYYSARGGNVKSDWHPGHTQANPPSLEKFANDVESEIECED